MGDKTDMQKAAYLETEVFDDVLNAEIRPANEDEWGDFVVVIGERTSWVSPDDRSLEEWARDSIQGEDEFFFEKVMYKHPSWSKDTVCVGYNSIENNPFRESSTHD